MVDREQPFDPRKQFSISPKVPLSELAHTPREMKLSEARMKIVQGMVQNVYELSGLSPDIWLPLVRKKYPFGRTGEKIVSGGPLLYKDISYALGREMFHRKWELHSPEIVYFSGFYVVNNLQLREMELEEKIRSIEHIVFIEHDVRDFKSEALERVRFDLEPVQQVREPIQEGLDIYTHAFLKGKEDVIKSLQQLASPINANNNTTTSKESN